MVVMGVALYVLETEWSAKLDDMYKRANKSLVMKCRYVEKVKLADFMGYHKCEFFQSC